MFDPFEDEEVDERGYVVFRSKRKRGKPMGHGAPHIPNKAERKLLTTMMRNSGQTEDQVRASKSNRQKLAKAAKSMSEAKGTRAEYELKKLKSRIADRTNLRAYDKRVLKIANLHLAEVKRTAGRIGWLSRKSLDEIIKQVLGE